MTPVVSPNAVGGQLEIPHYRACEFSLSFWVKIHGMSRRRKKVEATIAASRAFVKKACTAIMIPKSERPKEYKCRNRIA